MNYTGSPKPSLKRPGMVGRKAVSVSSTALVKVTPLQADRPFPLVIEPAVEGLHLPTWAQQNRAWLETQLRQYGGLLFRNFSVTRSPETLEQFIQATADGSLLSYQDGSSPRSQVQGNVYTSTDYPADQSIFLHSELSYAHTWPLKIYFFCTQAAEQGGETPIADIRKVFARLHPEITDRFRDRRVMYVRNFGNGFGLPWQTVFQTSDRTAVEAYCHENGITTEWRADGRLRTCQVRPAVTQHPLTREEIWFNHAAFFHISTLSPSMRAALLAEFSADELPYNTYYGDGSSIEESVVEMIRQAYAQETVMFPWQSGDLLMLDNMLTAHGRSPFAGPRKVLVGMAEPFTDQKSYS